MMMKNHFAKAFASMMLIATVACGGHVSSDSSIIAPEDFVQAIEMDTMAVVIDVRTAEEYAQGHLDGARLMDVTQTDDFMLMVDSLQADYTYYIYCRSGRRSRKAAEIMQKRGLKVVDMEGGYNAWSEIYGRKILQMRQNDVGALCPPRDI